jgi:hypothetical protein
VQIPADAPEGDRDGAEEGGEEADGADDWLALRCRRNEAGSISAPARKVSKTLPKPARKVIQSLVCMWRTLPASTPTPISVSATEMPVRMEIRLATSGRRSRARR